MDQCVLTLPALFDAVVARFAEERTSIPNLFGWRKATALEETGPRIVWVPGDPNGAIGGLTYARASVYSTPTTRILSTLGELFTLIVVSADPTDPENERKQYAAARALFNAWWRAAYLAANATLKPIALNWLAPTKVRRYGAAIRGVFAIDAPIPDTTLEVAPADTTVSIELSLLDRTETVAAPPEV